MNNHDNMKTENRNRWMVWAIVVLAILNITTLVTFIYHKNQAIEREIAAIPDPVKSETESMLYSGRYFREELNLSKEQMVRFSQFNPEFRQDARAINIKLAEKRHEMLVEMAEKNSDRNKLNLLSDSIGYLHAELKKITFMYYLNFKSICSQEQQKKLEQLFGEVFNSDTQILQNGAGRQGGRRYGWRNRD